jgi:putative salt-induced outer membrane protein YdiY/biopolymer transport protein ExbD
VLRIVNFCVVILFLATAPGVLADQITLKNGDHLTGKIVKSDGKTVVLHTDAAGDVTIDLKKITQITTDQQLHITDKTKKTVVGKVQEAEGQLQVTTKTGPVEVPVANVTAIRNDTEEAAYEKSLHPGLLRGWQGSASAGFSLARGNSETENLALAINLVHPTERDKILVYLSSVYTNNALVTPSLVANLVQAGLEYDHNLTPRVFANAQATFISNALQDLDLRGIYGGGLGVHAIKSDATTLDLIAGVNYTHETYSDGPPVTPPTIPPTYTAYGVTNRFAALTLEDDFMHKLGKSTVITEKLDFYPEITSMPGDYQGTFLLNVVTKVSKWLGWQNQFSDIYVSNPPVGTKKNDVVLTTGLNLTINH